MDVYLLNYIALRPKDRNLKTRRPEHPKSQTSALWSFWWRLLKHTYIEAHNRAVFLSLVLFLLSRFKLSEYLQGNKFDSKKPSSVSSILLHVLHLKVTGEQEGHMFIVLL